MIPRKLIAFFICLLLFPFLAGDAARPEKYLDGEGKQVRRALEGIAMRRVRSFIPPKKNAHPRKNTNKKRRGKARIAYPHSSRADLRRWEKLLSRTPSRYGMFVSIFDRRTRKLIGCMGGLHPTRDNLLAEVEHWTNIALLHDPRRLQGNRRKSPLARDAGRALLIITLIERVESAGHFMEVDSIRHGLMVRYRGRAELVLPGEAHTSGYAFRMLRRKLGLKNIPRSGLEYYRVRAVRFGTAKRLFQPGRAGFRGYGG